VKDNPRAVLEGELTIALLGFGIACLGSIVTAGGWYSSNAGRGYTFAGSRPKPAEPILGAIIFFFGLAVVVFGLNT
jgi:hypothetical protein